MGVTDKLPVALSTVLAIVLAIALALVAGPAAALGLGQISVKSQRNQPLVAEIPIISSDPSELEQLQARLASPETFRRIGMDPPQGVTADLQFAVALDAQGRPVIRVTSAAPVQQPLLTFLVEVDWGQGRLVREYSALLDTPRTVSAPLSPAIRAPTVAPPNTIVRPVQTPVVVAPLPQPPPQSTVPQPAVPPPPVPVVPAPQPEQPAPVAAIPIPPAPQPETSAPAAVPTPAAQPSGEYGPIKRGETLSQIAGRIEVGDGYSLDQTMLALLRANPDAFIGDNINLVKQGAVLRVPQPAELAQLDAAQAAVLVRDQIQQWRQAQRPVLQPAVADSARAQATTPSTRAATVGGSRNRTRFADARLAIVAPTSSSGRRAGTRSGIQTGGEGDMLRQELVQTKETLAARNAEVEELKARVADLEKLQQQQQQLITLKDSELAAAQQRLAASNREAAAPATTQTTASTGQPATPPQPGVDRSGGLIWLWGTLALLALIALAWWLARRRAAPAPRPSRVFDSAALAASMPTAASPTVPDTDAGAEQSHVETATVSASAPAAQWNVPPGAAPTWHAGSFDPNGTAAADPVPAGNERLQLARAYLDLGDEDAARGLLREVLDGRDPAARAEAARLLRDLN